MKRAAVTLTASALLTLGLFSAAQSEPSDQPTAPSEDPSAALGLSPKPPPNETDYRGAFVDLMKLAQGGDAWAQYQVGLFYATGHAVPRDLVQAAAWFKKAADQGNLRAQASLGADYAVGQGVPKDIPEALRLLRPAADKGDAGAAVELARLYATGDGVPKDFVEARRLLQIGVAANDLAAIALLGSLDIRPDTKMDPAEGVRLLTYAAERDNYFAQVDLGAAYAIGQGVHQDLPTALKWFLIAANRASSAFFPKLRAKALENAAKVEARLTADQISAAKVLASGWTPVKRPPLREPEP